MVIDIQPTEREPNDLEKAILEFNDHDALYYFIQDGKEHSVRWTEKQLKDFLPSWTVSEYMEHHLQRHASTFAVCAAAWEKNQHPYWTEREGMVNGRMSYREVPMSLDDRHTRASALHWMNNAYIQFTKPLEFVVVRRVAQPAPGEEVPGLLVEEACL